MFTRVLRDSFLFLKAKPLRYWYPLLPVLAVQIAFDHLRLFNYIPDNLLMGLVSLALAAVLAVTTHRLVLIGPEAVPKLGFRMWSRRETHFLAYMIGIQLLTTVPLGIVSLVLIPLVGVTIELPILGSFGLWIILVSIPILIVVSRFCLVLPATAVDNPIFFSGSWSVTRDHKLAVFFLVCIAPALLALPAIAIALYDSEVSTLLASLLGSVGLVIGIVVLSTAYRLFIENADA